MVCGIAASLRTPYVMGAVKRAKKLKAHTIYITTNPRSRLGLSEFAKLSKAIDVAMEGEYADGKQVSALRETGVARCLDGVVPGLHAEGWGRQRRNEPRVAHRPRRPSRPRGELARISRNSKSSNCSAAAAWARSIRRGRSNSTGSSR